MTSFSRPFRLERRSVAFLDFFFFFDFLFFLMILRFVPSWFFLRFLGSHVSEESHESSTYFRFILCLARFECLGLGRIRRRSTGFTVACTRAIIRISTSTIIFIIGWFIRHFSYTITCKSPHDFDQREPIKRDKLRMFSRMFLLALPKPAILLRNNLDAHK